MINRITCPSSDFSKNERVNELKQSIENWIYSDALCELTSIFNFEFSPSLSIVDDINKLNFFAEIWDYRRKQADGGERWTLKEDSFFEKKRERLLCIFEQLGLTSIEDPIINPDYILPLGGARMTNYDRPKLSKKIIDEYSLKNLCIVALTGQRQIDEIEIPFINEYATGAKTEYDAICMGMQEIFSLSCNEQKETVHHDENINLCWSLREYSNRYKNNKIFVLAAPSSDIKRRANSLDTFKFFLNRFSIEDGKNLLLVTSCIYVPFQLLKFIPLAIENSLNVDCVGVNTIRQGNLYSNLTNYCQEVKSTINAIKKISDLYFIK